MTGFWIGFTLVLIGAALAGIATVLLRYFKDMRAARERLDHSGSQIIETKFGTVEYARVGSGYPLLVLHGAIGE